MIVLWKKIINVLLIALQIVSQMMMENIYGMIDRNPYKAIQFLCFSGTLNTLKGLATGSSI